MSCGIDILIVISKNFLPLQEPIYPHWKWMEQIFFFKFGQHKWRNTLTNGKRYESEQFIEAK